MDQRPMPQPAPSDGRVTGVRDEAARITPDTTSSGIGDRFP
jgi:hypothetical protein